MRVLVTGATTPVGAALVERLLADPSTRAVLAVAREPIPAATLGRDKRLHTEQFDLTRERDVRTLMKGQVRALEIDAIVHGALHRSAHDRGRKVHAMNVESTRALLAQVQQHPTIKRFVYRSYAEVYRLDSHLPTLIGEDHPLEFSPRAPQRVRDRVESDLTACALQGLSACSIAVLRCAEVLAPDSGSQLWDYLEPRVCFYPAGYDPIVNVASVDDIVTAIAAALRCDAQGVFNIPGADSLPLSELIERCGRRAIPVPGPLLSPLYRLRRSARKSEFRYDLNKARFHLSSVLDGTRAREVLGYRATASVFDGAPR